MFQTFYTQSSIINLMSEIVRVQRLIEDGGRLRIALNNNSHDAIYSSRCSLEMIDNELKYVPPNKEAGERFHKNILPIRKDMEVWSCEVDLLLCVEHYNLRELDSTNSIEYHRLLDLLDNKLKLLENRLAILEKRSATLNKNSIFATFRSKSRLTFNFYDVTQYVKIRRKSQRWFLLNALHQSLINKEPLHVDIVFEDMRDDGLLRHTASSKAIYDIKDGINKTVSEKTNIADDLVLVDGGILMLNNSFGKNNR